MKKQVQKKLESYKEGFAIARENHLLGVILNQVRLSDGSMVSTNWLKQSMCTLEIGSDSIAVITVNKNKKMSKEEWVFVYLTVATILGLNLYKRLVGNSFKENYLSIILFAIYYVKCSIGNDDLPTDWSNFYSSLDDFSFKNEVSICEQLLANPSLYLKYSNLSLAGGEVENSIVIDFKKSQNIYFGSYKKSFNDIFGENLIVQAQRTISMSMNKSKVQTEEEVKNQSLESYKAKKWFMNHFPLLAGIVSQFEIIEDIKSCQIRDIKIAAVSVMEKRIYINPLMQLNEQGMRFVMAHEVLHVALNHAGRCQDKDHLTWNLACDFVINQWLVEMGIGVPPESIYSDEKLNGKSADEVYLMITQDNRIKRKLGTLKNPNAGSEKKESVSDCDMLDTDPKYFSDFEDACKRALLRGVFLHEMTGRGDLPADFVEEIKFINQPPIPWQAGLADWISEKFPLLECRRTYSRPSRRQSSTPDIPRARYVKPEEDKLTRTYGVVIDTSGSVDRKLLAKSIGAVVSYSHANDVKYVRLVFCDAQAYDEGYVSIDSLLNKISVKGRGGTVLQPAINMLEHALDFPKNAPILVISDGFFERDLTIAREHAFLVPNKGYLPFIPKGKVFEFEK